MQKQNNQPRYYKTPAQKFFAYFFTKNKVSHLQCKSRKTNFDINILP